MTPYENRIELDGYHRIGLLARVDLEHRGVIGDLLMEGGTDDEEPGEVAGIANLRVFSREVDGVLCVFAFFYFGGDDPDEASDHLESEFPGMKSLRERSRNSDGWERMEMINVIALAPISDDAVRQCHGAVGRLNPADEFTYRTLHQTNWPGVVDRLNRSNYRNWTTYLVEWGEGLLMFTYYEYVGSDRASDDAAMAADATSKRWWKLTIPCLLPLEDGGEYLTEMDLVGECD